MLFFIQSQETRAPTENAGKAGRVCAINSMKIRLVLVYYYPTESERLRRIPCGQRMHICANIAMWPKRSSLQVATFRRSASHPALQSWLQRGTLTALQLHEPTNFPLFLLRNFWNFDIKVQFRYQKLLNQFTSLSETLKATTRQTSPRGRLHGFSSHTLSLPGFSSAGSVTLAVSPKPTSDRPSFAESLGTCERICGVMHLAAPFRCSAPSLQVAAVREVQWRI